ncbi:hypothetical protein G8A07_14860 [Roseateles sp. DAIF2]|uniref:chemotaxis protein CheW n=1 Tax=Roseateles sp. DAIF2 TaxID=2714952 RepID=UPI0018A2611D|nr:chemotaxis protein CheW [Roseateles sp. DAIF2]QPF74070.1 hypothetical protein G8A07_14860 [Roseateles sp. DAIF2]
MKHSSAPNPAQVPADAEPLQYLGFRLADRDYALLLSHVLAIHPHAQTQRLAAAPPWVQGMYDQQQQRYVPVLDLRALQDLDSLPPPVDPRQAVLILAELALQRVALLADAVVDLLEPAPQEYGPAGMRLCRMQGLRGPRRVQLLDLRQLIALLPPCPLH